MHVEVVHRRYQQTVSVVHHLDTFMFFRQVFCHLNDASAVVNDDIPSLYHLEVCAFLGEEDVRPVYFLS